MDLITVTYHAGDKPEVIDNLKLRLLEEIDRIKHIQKASETLQHDAAKQSVANMKEAIAQAEKSITDGNCLNMLRCYTFFKSFQP